MQTVKRNHPALLRSTVIVLLALALLVSTIGGAQAEETACSVTVTTDLSPAEKADLVTGAGLVLDVYQIAALDVDSVSFTLLDPYTGLALDVDNADMAQKATALALGTTPLIANAQLDMPLTLDPGLYLILAHGSLTDYVENRTDSEGNPQLVTLAKSGSFLYRFLPMLVSLPNRTDGEDWDYNLTVPLKVEQTGYVDIAKTLRTYEESEGTARFLFDVEAELDGELVYSNVEYMDFTAAETQVKRIEGLSEGTTVTVTEVYSGARYRLEGSNTQTVTVEYGESATVTFVNDYYPSQVSGETVVNQFTYGEGEYGGTWSWVKLD